MNELPELPAPNLGDAGKALGGWSAAFGSGALLAAVLGLGLGAYGYAKAKKGTKMTALEKTFSRLVQQLLNKIELLEAENDELVKRPSKSYMESTEKKLKEVEQEVSLLRTAASDAQRARDKAHDVLDAANAEITRLRAELTKRGRPGKRVVR